MIQNLMKRKKNELTSNLTNLTDLRNQLGHLTYQGGIKDNLRYMFKDDTFVEKMNYDTNIILFENGVYDVNHSSFRRATPDDHMSFSVGYHYNVYNNDHSDIKKIHEILSYLFPLFEERQSLLEFLSKTLFGKEIDRVQHNKAADKKKIIYKIHTLESKNGNSGMSTLMRLIKYTFGELVFQIPQTGYLDSKYTRSLRGKRLMLCDIESNYHSFDESESRKCDNSFKNLVSYLILLQNLQNLLNNYLIQDIFYLPSFHNYWDDYRYIPIYNVLTCMDSLTNQSLDSYTIGNCALFRKDLRLLSDLVVRHPLRSKFVKDPTHQNEFEADHDMYNEIEKLAPAFMSLLIRSFNT